MSDLIARLRNLVGEIPLSSTDRLRIEAAIALEAQADESEALKAGYSRVCETGSRLEAECKRAYAEIEALRADAERWQFLKTHGISVYYNYGTLSKRQVPCSVMDEDIDAAIKAGKAVTP